MGDVEVGGELGFELLALGAGGDPPAAENLDHGVDVALADLRRGEEHFSRFAVTSLGRLEHGLAASVDTSAECGTLAATVLRWQGRVVGLGSW